MRMYQFNNWIHKIFNNKEIIVNIAEDEKGRIIITNKATYFGSFGCWYYDSRRIYNDVQKMNPKNVNG